MGIMQVRISMAFSMAVLLNNLVAITIDLRSPGEISHNLKQPKSLVFFHVRIVLIYPPQDCSHLTDNQIIARYEGLEAIIR